MMQNLSEDMTRIYPTAELEYHDAEKHGGTIEREEVAHAVWEWLLYGDPQLPGEEDEDWSDDMYVITLPTGERVDCCDLVDEVYDAIRRYRRGEPVLQSIPVKEEA